MPADDSEHAALERVVARPIADATPAAWGFRMLELLVGDTLTPDVERIVADRLRAELR